MSGITVIKRNPAGLETWRYSGNVLKKTENAIVLEALFNLDDTPFMGIQLNRSDRFVEVFYTDRWYNIFEIHDRDNNNLKGWYCNVCKPVIFEADDQLSFIDLALDLWVSPDGTQTVLDEDEFEASGFDESTNKMALNALDELKTLFANSKSLRIGPDWI